MTIEATFVDIHASTVTVAVRIKLLLPRFEPLLEPPERFESAKIDVARLSVYKAYSRMASGPMSCKSGEDYRFYCSQRKGFLHRFARDRTITFQSIRS